MLTRNTCAQKRDFSIVFRTFGSDIMEVVDEMNMFATGQHPCYPEVIAPMLAPIPFHHPYLEFMQTGMQQLAQFPNFRSSEVLQGPCRRPWLSGLLRACVECLELFASGGGLHLVLLGVSLWQPRVLW